MRLSHKLPWLNKKWEHLITNRPTLEAALSAYDMTLPDFYIDMAMAMGGVVLPLRSLRDFGRSKRMLSGTDDLLPSILADDFSIQYFNAYHLLRINPAVEAFRIKHCRDYEQWGCLYLVMMLERFMNKPENVHRDFGELLIEFLLKISNEEQAWDMLEKMIRQANNQQHGQSGRGGNGQEEEMYDMSRKMDRLVRVTELVDKLMLDYVFASKNNTEMIETKQPDEDLSVRTNNSITEISKATMNELVKDGDIAMRALENKLSINVHMTPDTPPRNFIMLIDQSGSMDCRFEDDYTRFDYALASAICLVKNVLKGSNKAKIAFFDYAVDPVYDADDPTIIANLMGYAAGGGGTSIQTALLWAQEQKPDEIIIISDGEDSVNETLFDKDMPPITMFFIGQGENPLEQKVNVFHKVESV